ncbi:MAG TPA: hypothetical protein VKV40_08525 [Ktedonobacteraceae bacterium]|nr:hypothetical protein [Ktedonobacteraceae bacterium]
MSDGSFDLILQELLHQQEIMNNLEAENRELRQQLADLREGRGIFVEIDGIRFPLISESGAPGTIPARAESFPTEPMVPVRPRQEEVPAFVAQETTAGQQSFAEEAEPVVSEKSGNFLLDDDEPITAFPFLQESFEEEASAIATNKMAIWGESPSTPFPTIASSQPVTELMTEPIQKPVPSDKPQQPVAIDEDEKAALRRQLIGSFLLE